MTGPKTPKPQTTRQRQSNDDNAFKSSGSRYSFEIAQVADKYVKDDAQSCAKDYDEKEEQGNHKQLALIIEEFTATVQAT